MTLEGMPQTPEQRRAYRDLQNPIYAEERRIRQEWKRAAEQIQQQRAPLRPGPRRENDEVGPRTVDE